MSGPNVDPRLIWALRALLAELRALVSAEAATELASEISALVAEADSADPRIEDRLLDLLSRHEPVRRWVAEYLARDRSEARDVNPVEKGWLPLAPVDRFRSGSPRNGDHRWHRIHWREGSAPSDARDRRTIDANLLVERFAPGEMATLTVTIRLTVSPLRGRWHETMEIDPEAGPVRVFVEAAGFEICSEPPLVVPPDRDAAPIAFELRITEAEERWIHILLTQGGTLVGELTISEFSDFNAERAGRCAAARFRRIAEADLVLVVRAAEGRIEASSPSEVASLDHVPMAGFRYPALPFRELLADRLRALYDARSDPEATARELQIVGVELAGCLPPDLLKLLRRRDIRTVMLRHEDDFDFPLELCYLDDARDPFFVGDRVAVCRWYLGATSLPNVVEKRIRRVTLLRGAAGAFRADEAVLDRLFPGRTETFDRRSEFIERVFKTSEFDVIHFTGHCRQQEKASGGLELASGEFLRLIEIGQLEAERAFAAARPFVMLNACASVQPYLGLTQRGSFAHRFVGSRACAVVGTLWPVAGAVANEFAERFYAELAAKPVGRALLDAKSALLREDAGTGGDRSSALRRLARQVALRSYCLFANPDLRLVP